MKHSIHIALAQTIFLFAPGMYALAAEHNVPCNTLPRAVQQKSKSIVEGATIHACIRDSSNGKTSYELELLKNGRSRDLTFDSDGNLLEIEEQVDIASLPQPVAAAIQKAAAGGHVGKVESLTRGGTLIGYEATVTHNSKRREVAFHPDGSAMNAD
jgi:hypothetical protein